jgi:NAD(P)-dependent dehydrogenase (short-subunit alcohol dehydrogenase family)
VDSLEGRVALVTGGGRGIGRSIALALARAGVHVAVAARTIPEIEEVAAEASALGPRAIFLPLDMGDRSAFERVAAEVASALGPIAILVNNAGLGVHSAVHNLDDADWDAIIAVNLTGPVLLTRACLPQLYGQGWGRVINIASVAGKIGLKYGAAYSASKHGLIGFTRSLALEAARKGVTVNAICPGWTETRMMRESVEAIALHTQRTEQEARAAILQSTPLRRPAQPDEVADVAVWLAGSPMVTGQSVNVDGGEVMS